MSYEIPFESLAYVYSALGSMAALAAISKTWAIIIMSDTLLMGNTCKFFFFWFFLINIFIINIKRECGSISIEGNLSCTPNFFLEGVPLNFYIKRGFDSRL